jgi:acetylglutamate kinase
MQAKLESSLEGLQAGIRQVVISSGREPDICRRILANESIGTSVAWESAEP